MQRTEKVALNVQDNVLGRTINVQNVELSIEIWQPPLPPKSYNFQGPCESVQATCILSDIIGLNQCSF